MHLKMKLLIRVSFLFFFLFFCENAYAVTAWVSSNGAAAWGSCQGASPLSGASACSVTTMNSNMSAGDIIYLRDVDGNYSGDRIIPGASGSAGNYITIQSYADETPTFTNATNDVAQIIGRSYIKIIGIDIHGPSAGRWIEIDNSNNIIIEDCNMNNLQSGTSYSATKWIDSNNLQFIDCSWDGTIASAVQFDAVSTDNCNYILYLRCSFKNATHNLHDDLSGYTQNENVYMVFKDCTVENTYHSGIAIGLYATRRYLVDGCTFKNGGSGTNPYDPTDNGIDPALYVNSQYSIIRYNTFYDNNTHIYLRTSGSPNEDSRNVWIYNNTMYNALKHTPGGYSDAWFTGMSIFGESDDGLQHKYNVIKNNIMWKSEDDTQLTIYSTGTGLDPNNNTFSGNFIGDDIQSSNLRYDPDTNTLSWFESNDSDWVSGTNYSNDPWMLDPDNQDFNLSAISTAINQGVELTRTNGSGSNSTSLVVDDNNGLFTGAGSPWLIDHDDISADTIYIEDTGSVRISSISGDTNITLEEQKTWGDNKKVYYCPDGVCFGGINIDVGAYEYDAAPPDTPEDEEVELLAHYLLENNGDDETTNNLDLTENNTPVYNSGSPLEGSYSFDVESTDSPSKYFSRDGTFMDTRNQLSIFGAFSLESLPSSGYFYGIVSRYDVNNNRSWNVTITSAGYLRIYVGFNNGASYEYFTHETILSLSTTYYFLIWLDPYVDDEGKIFIKDVDGNTIGDDYVYANLLSGETWNKGTSNLSLGAYYNDTAIVSPYDGLIDHIRIYQGLLPESVFLDLIPGSSPDAKKTKMDGISFQWSLN